VHFINKKSPCFGDSKHTFKFKIVQGLPEKNGFKNSARFTIILYSSAADIGKQEKPDRFVNFTNYFQLQNGIFKKSVFSK
jgi:hypothetical protein